MGKGRVGPDGRQGIKFKFQSNDFFPNLFHVSFHVHCSSELF